MFAHVKLKYEHVYTECLSIQNDYVQADHSNETTVTVDIDYIVRISHNKVTVLRIESINSIETCNINHN